MLAIRSLYQSSESKIYYKEFLQSNLQNIRTWDGQGGRKSATIRRCQFLPQGIVNRTSPRNQTIDKYVVFNTDEEPILLQIRNQIKSELKIEVCQISRNPKSHLYQLMSELSSNHDNNHLSSHHWGDATYKNSWQLRNVFFTFPVSVGILLAGVWGHLGGLPL